MANQISTIYQGTGKLATFVYSPSRRALNVFDNILVRLSSGSLNIASYCMAMNDELLAEGFQTEGLDVSLIDQNIFKVNIGADKTARCPVGELVMEIKLVYLANENQSESWRAVVANVIKHSLKNL
jgi:hypothetical protein